MQGVRYKRNIGLNYGFSVLLNLSFTHGIWMVYLAKEGFSLAQLGVLEAIFHITSFLMEVPTGSVADLWGRKASRMAGRLCYAFSLVFMYSGNTLAVQAFAFILSALGYNLESGAGDALVYDSLLLDGQEGRYMQVRGREEVLCQACNIISFLVGGYLALLNAFWAFSLTILTSVFAFLLALFFKEPQLKREAEHSHRFLASLRHQVFDSTKVVAKTPRIAYLIVFSESIFAFMISLFFYLQNYWDLMGYTVGRIGLIYSLHAFVAAICSWKAPVIERMMGQKGILVFSPLVLLVCLWGVPLTPYSVFFYILLGCVEGVLAPTISSYLNGLIPSLHRATILSFQSMAYSLFMIAIFPLVGLLGQHYSLSFSFALMAGMATLLAVPFVILVVRNSRN